MKHIVIIGGSFAGVSTAHRFLKNISKSTTAPYKITLVSRDTHFYWNIATPRAIIPGQIPDEKLFQPIAAGFSQYGSDKFEFVLGTATSIDVEGKQLAVSDVDGKETTIAYDYLVIGTGSQTKVDGPFKSSGSTEATLKALHAFQEYVQDAESVVIVGAGPTGVETAGELAFEYPKHKIILISSGPTVLENRPASVSKAALKILETLNVDVRLNTKVQEPVHLPSGKQELTLSGGEKLIVDLYIPTFGVVPNSSFIPSQFLDSNGFVKVDEYFGVKDAKGVFAIGDVNNAEAPQFWFVEKQSTHVAKNLVLTLGGKPPVPYKASTTGMMGLQIGKKSGTGHFGNFKLPSFLVTNIRKTLFVDNLPKTVHGSML